MMKLISAEELADLSDNWENATVDTRKYYQCVFHAWETTEQMYLTWKKSGGLCQRGMTNDLHPVPNGKFYVA